MIEHLQFLCRLCGFEYDAKKLPQQYLAIGKYIANNKDILSRNRYPSTVLVIGVCCLDLYNCNLPETAVLSIAASFFSRFPSNLAENPDFIGEDSIRNFLAKHIKQKRRELDGT
jgi:hypothetical protein